MITEPSNPEELLSFIRNWFRLLASGQWEEASAMLDEPNTYGIRWTADYIRYAVDLAYGPGCRFRVAHPEGPQFSNPEVATGILHNSIGKFDDGSGYWADHDVPLNGEWSDLTAQFEFRRRPTGFAVVLHDLHIM